WAGLVDAGTTGAELQALFETKYNEKTGSTIPLKASSVDKVYTYSSWNTSLETVTAAATYTANYTWVTRKYHVTFYNYDAVSVLYETDVDYNTNPTYGGVTPFRANTSAYSYNWTGWQQGATTYTTSATLPVVTGDIYYIATFEQTELKYQVFFKRQDGSIVEAPFFSFEEMPAAFPANPTMASTVSTDYTFREWSPATLVPVTEDGKVYTALFDESPRKYTAHFVNYNGTSLNADQTIDYNTVPAYTGATPIKPNDSRNSYEFSGWAWAAGDGWEAGSIGVGETLPAIKGNITFTAQYTPTLLQFDVIYQREDGTVILRDKKKWGESTAFPTSGLDYEDATYTYTFDHWSPATVVNPVTTDATYTAYFNQSVKSYSITAVGISPADYGTVSPASLSGIPGGSAVTVNGNKITVNGTDITATPTAATAQYTYAFDHWNNVPATVTGNVTNIEAVFTRMVNQYEVTFNMKGHGAAISSQTKDYGSKVDQPADPSEAGYTFVGWYKEDACTNAWNFASDEVTDATTLFAKWTVNSYTITFDGNGGSEVASITQNYGTEITPPANPTRTGYTFAGWDPAVPATMPVDGETCVAQWTINSYQVKFVDEDGTTNLGSYPQTLDYGTAVTAPEEPTKAADATNVYTFAGWSDGVSTYASADIPAVSGAVTYTATYNSAPTVASVTVSGATTYYATLQAAFDYAANKTTPTITMLQSVTDITTPLTYTNSSNTTVTFELNGKTVSGGVTSKTYLLYITGNNSGLFKIQDSAGDGKISNTMSKNAAHYCVYVYNCPTELRSGTIYMENKSTSSSVQAFGVNVRGSRKFEMKGGTIEVKSSKNAHAIYSSGTTNISAGTLIATETKNGYASGVHVINGKTTITGTPTFTISGTKYVNGVRVGGLKPALNSKKTAVTQYNGTADIQGGTYIVTASSNTAYGVLCYRDTLALSYADNTTCPGNYAGAGKVTISGGEFTVSSTGATAYGICTQSAYTVTSAKAADGVTLLSSNTVTPKTTITGGKFNVSGSSSVGAVNTSATADNLLVQGGWYNINTNLSTKYTAPTKSCNYHVLDLTGEDPYMYEVAEAYQLAWNLDGGTVVTAGTQAPADATGTPSGYVAKGATLTAPVVEKTGYTFDGWNTSGGTAAATMPAENTTYTAIWVAAIVDRELDIVDWTSSSITINVTNLKAVGGTNKNNWKIRVNGTDYTRTSPECSTQSRTLTISGLSLTPNENLLVQLKNDADVIESQHNYMIPQIYTANATLSGTTEESVVYVYGGKLTISGTTTLAALYVCPGAEVEVTGTLTVGKLVLRTKPWATAAISGNVSATNVYYTRIAPDGSSEYPTGQYYQFGLPYACAVSAVSLSDGTTPVYNSTWLLKSYNEERRAASGTSTNNWDALAADATIEAGRGYEMFSSYKYYREYYFPVTPTDNTSVAVTRHGDDKNNSGWNIVCSPLMNVYENESDPVDGLKVSWLLADGSYDQAWPEVIWPAMPFSYQASANGDLDFSSGEFNQTVSAPRRAGYKENIQTEWLHLDVKDGNGVGDHTSVFVHPDRFEATYETGIDVAKQSLTASRAILYSSHAYGDMAFAGVSDSLLEKGVALTVYSPKEQELTISMRNNNRLNRLAAVWLIDYEKGMTTDLLWNDYTFDAVSGTMSGRFILQGAFFAPGVATDLDNIQGDNIQNTKARKVIIDQKMYIQINGRLYDANGKLLKTEH
ncbi:MAG: InlB B-repeat-containing protein, partial [Paludibacteraceae bacterium]|nr:InlB B-repeat-containing protein [Paludibacteraceae bacterium]